MILLSVIEILNQAIYYSMRTSSLRYVVLHIFCVREPFGIWITNNVFLVQLSDFGLAHSSRDGSVCFEPVNTDIRGTPGLGEILNRIT